MAYADPGPLMEEHLDELELICRASENDGHFETLPPGHETTAIDDFLPWTTCSDGMTCTRASC